MSWFLPILLTIAVLGIIANGCILLSIVKYKILRKNTYAFLVSLAICDSLKVLVIINIIIYNEVEKYSELGCMEISLIGFTLLCCTTLHLAAEGIHRYLMVEQPYKYARIVVSRTKHIVGVVLLLWILPIIFGIVVPIAWFHGHWKTKLHFHAKMFGCPIDKNSIEGNESYVVIMYVIFFAFPLVIMFLSYGHVLKTSYSVAKDLRLTEVQKERTPEMAVRKTTYANPVIEMVSATYGASVLSNELAIKNKIEHQSERTMSIAQAQMNLKRKIKTRKRELKSSKTVLIMISAFIVCNAPIFTVVWFSDRWDEEKADNLLKGFLALSQIQVFVNPLVYFLRLRDFKDARKTCKNVGSTIIRKTIRRL